MTKTMLLHGDINILYFLLVAGYLFFLYRVNKILSLS
jgi:hypothetical protein